MKKSVCILLLIILSSFAFAFSCSGGKDQGGDGKKYYSFTISETELTLDEGESEKLVCSYGDKTILFSSSDEKIAEVKADGTITAISAGVAYITAKADGEDGVEKICKVTVVKNEYTIEIDRTDGITALVGAKLAFRATVYKNGEITALSVKWSVTPSGLTVTEKDGVATIEFTAAGEYEVKATYGNAEKSLKVKVVSEIGEADV